MAHKLPLADIQFIADFAAFCRSKGDEVFNGDKPKVCALAQFGHPGVTSCAPGAVPAVVYDAVLLIVGGRKFDKLPVTFSALADRLEALIADAPTVERDQ